MAKKVPKRKRQNVSISDTSQQSERIVHSSTTSIGRKERKKTTGAIFMPEIWKLPPSTRLSVDCNEFGQPIDDNRSKFACFLGVMARTHTYAPIDILDLRKMPKSKKLTMLELLKEKFDCPPGMDEWILQSIGIKWRLWKADLKYDYFDAAMPLEDLVKERDERVDEQQWRRLLMYWLSDKGKEASIRGQQSRKHKILNHKTGRRPFAQVRKNQGKEIGRTPTRVESYRICYPVETDAEARQKMIVMDELINGLEDHPSKDIVAKDDVFAMINGPDKPGRVRMMGHGVTLKDVFDAIPSRKTLNHMLKETMTETQKLRVELQVYRQQQMTNQQSMNNSAPPISSPQPYLQQHTTSNPSSSLDVLPLQVDCPVIILSIVEPSKIVARGVLRSMEPTAIVGFEPLGKNWCSVHINVAVDGEERLIRSVFMHQTIGEAIGGCVAWPSNLVVRVED